MKKILVLSVLLAPMIQFPAAAQQLTFGQLCELIIEKPSAIPKGQAYVIPKVRQNDQPLFGGNITTCVIYQMASHNLHQENWDYSKQAVQWYNQQARSRRDAIASELSKASSQYPDLKALVDLNYIEVKKSVFTGHYVAPGPGPTQ